MTVSERIKHRREALGITQTDLALSVGITKQQMYKYENGIISNIPSDKIEALAQELQTTPQFLMGWVDTPVKHLSDDAPRILQIHASLNDAGQAELERYGDYLTEQEIYRRNDTTPPITYIRHYLVPAAAGYASPIEGEDYEMIPLPKAAPRRADFCITISGDSMEPYIHDGELVYVRRGMPLQEFDVGVFYVDGDVLCKQYCTDPYNTLYLLSANPKREDANRMISASSTSTVICFGKVLLPRPLPRPSYY